ncbi:AlpA family transcriptional regulator [Bradyrhizobium sp. WSM1417]|uniref:helix-turn-helix transcriptional regulator n=1 Tax=Bradyrhizobium sp. WSM1417 TaxID=754500 RepID=UPI0007C53E9F|nr:hypothetical protein [Bradyrhizobium sp. WSM1417]
MTRPDNSDRPYPNRGLRREDAAAWVGFKPSTFDKLIAEGLMPRGKLVHGCRIWDRYELDRAFESLPDESAPSPASDAPLQPQAGGWAKVN